MFEPNASWYEPDCEPTLEDQGLCRIDEQPDIEHLKDHLQGVAEAFYRSGDTGDLERCLDECFHTLGLTLSPAAQPAMEKRGQRDLMHWFLGYQRSQIDFMNQNNLTVEDYQHYTKEMHHGTSN